MVIDTSAIVAIAKNEPEAATFEKLIADDPVRLISTATVLEAAMVLEMRFGELGGADLWLARVEVEHADQARRASRVAALRQRPSPSQLELWGLYLLRACQARQ